MKKCFSLFLVVALVVTAALLMMGCRSMFGLATISLIDKNVCKIEVGVLSQTKTACPGQPMQLKVYAHTVDNVVL